MLDLKTQLADFNQQQKNDFAQRDIFDLLQQRSDFYDQLLITLWQQYGLAERADLALIAVGGYGRKEMFPLSDLDILVLTENPIDESTQTQLNQLFNQLWDSKFQLGTAIRTVSESIEIGRAEISVATNMLESRFVTGNFTLWQQLSQAMQQADFWRIEDFFSAKIAEKNERYARYHNTSYNLEPDLKHSPGGLRDLHLIGWIMLRHYGTYSFEDLLRRGILFPAEYQELSQAQAVLFRMRFGLHLQLKRYDNRLRFDRQVQLSEQLGYQGADNQAVEAMMRTFFLATQSISQLSQLLLDNFKRTVLLPPKLTEKHPLDPHYFLRDNIVFAEDYAIFEQKPYTILDLFLHLCQNPDSSPSVTTLRFLRLSLQKLSSPLSECPQARQRFIQLFSLPNPISRAIVPMHQLGVLDHYLPQWQGIKGLMQFDLFHTYTVDEHTVQVMLQLENFLTESSKQTHPLCSQLFTQSTHRPLLYLAGLFHDIAKGRNGDHATLGAVDMYEFAIQHDFRPEQAKQMAWLVREHLTMSITAQRRDIHDPTVVEQFAQIVENQTALSDLVCLTVADIKATNETLWNDWKRSLFTQLYQLTAQQLNKRLDYQQIAQQHRLQALELIKFTLTPNRHKILRDFWQPCPESYFLRNTPKQLVWHALAYLKTPKRPLVLVSNEHARGATEIFIHCDDQPQLFARIAQMLSSKKVSIHDAQIITSESGLVFDSFIITELNGNGLDNLRSEQIQQALQKMLSQPTPFKPNRKPIKHQTFKRQTQIRFLAHSHPNQTAFELFTLDREGLLAQISHIFNQLDLILLNAKISTIGERVEDFFVVTTLEQQALSTEQQRELSEQLLSELDGE